MTKDVELFSFVLILRTICSVCLHIY
jgi:hypothetical protein